MITGTISVTVGTDTHEAKVDFKTLARLEESGLSLMKTCTMINKVRQENDPASFPFARVASTVGVILRGNGVKVADEAIYASYLENTDVVGAMSAIDAIAKIAFPEREPEKKAEADQSK
jgi:hypothetical protein